ncbi:superoxide dismutase [Virgibacillus profundi]|uniref:Superoxide dismutase [Cu-Zn] n=1 Tax=Virgibacillus profundi TaxID=2024555 RepID=A0A2A2IIM7_9BACI|nr:superoxide dismutase family protein [Virgibacillus profundi]PAV31487.1 superoxide dismutase [Virgibacillus profundi]PXY55673.1 superoxide dismutase family protein [Virgibacillus profundi]
MKRWILFLFTAVIAIMLSACGGTEEEQQDNADQDKQSQEEQENNNGSGESGEEQTDNATEEEEVLVSLNDAEGNVVAIATLMKGDTGVDITLEGTDLPAGTHGFHIHETGNCEVPDFKSAGGHFNPTDANHGFDDPEGPHAGDLPNIDVAEDGTANVDVTAEMVTLEKDQDNSLYKEGGTALMIHSKADDNKSQPSGDAGDRIACGVIGE